MDLDGVAAADTTSLTAVIAERHRAMVQAEADLLVLAAVWADHNGSDPFPDAKSLGPHSSATEQVRVLGGEGTPAVWEFAAAELGAVQEMSPYAASRLIADALDLRHRLPRLWRRLVAGEVRAWKCREVAKATRHLSQEAADLVDRAVADVIVSLPWGRFLNRLSGKIIEADPADAEARAAAYAAERFVRTGQSEHGLKTLVARAAAGDVIWFAAMVDRIALALAADGDCDTLDVRRSKAIGVLAQPARAVLLLSRARTPSLDEDGEASEELGPPECAVRGLEALQRVDPERLMPPVTVYLHLHEETVRSGGGAARCEGVGPLVLSQVRELLATGCKIRLQPVIDPTDAASVDCYEAPQRIREALHLRSPADVFPFATMVGRRMDFDHTTPYLSPAHGGPPGQTGLANGGFLSRFHHRLRTHGRWRIRQPDPGSYLWRSPHGWHFLVNGTGTHNLGNSPFARAVWDAAAACVELFPPVTPISYLPQTRAG
jgi:hypothetical protein